MAGRRGLESGEMPDLTLVINGINLGTHRLQEENFSLTVPLNNIPNISQVIWLNLTVSHAEAVFNESHEVVDSRLIGAALIAFGIFEDKTSKRQRVL